MLKERLQTVFTNIGIAIKSKISVSDKGAPNGVASLDSASKIPKTQLPKDKSVIITSNLIDLELGVVFIKTVTVNTTFTVSNIAETGNVNSFMLELINGGAYTVTWFNGIKWAGGTVPSLTVSGKDVIGFYTYDAGTTWVGSIMKDVK